MIASIDLRDYGHRRPLLLFEVRRLKEDLVYSSERGLIVTLDAGFNDPGE